MNTWIYLHEIDDYLDLLNCNTNIKLCILNIMYRGLKRVYLKTCIKNLSKCCRKHVWQRNRIHHTVSTTFTIYPIGLMYRRLNQDITCIVIHERLLDAHICDIHPKIAITVQFPTHNMDRDALSIDCHQHPEGCLENNIFIEIIFSDLVARKWQAAIVKQLIIRVQQFNFIKLQFDRHKVRAPSIAL